MKTSALIIACMLSACASSHKARERAEQNAGEAGVYYQGDGPFAPVAEESYGAALNELLVQESERCCQEIGLPFEAAPSRTETFPQGFAPADPESGARYQAGAAAACLAEIEQRVCPHSKDPPLADGESPCGALYRRGEREPGEPCMSSWDCAAGGSDTFAVCTGERGARRCALQRALHEGEPCTDTDPSARCAYQLFCDPTRNRCVQRAAYGQPCVTGPNFGDTCAEGAVCDRQVTKRCVRPRAVGARCSALEECEDLACVDGVCREALAVHPICSAARPAPLRR